MPPEAALAEDRWPAAVSLMAVLVVSSCFNPTFPEGYRCSSGETCPSDQVCSGHRVCRLPQHVPQLGASAPRPHVDQLVLHRIATGIGVDSTGADGYVITANIRSFRLVWSGAMLFRGSLYAEPGSLRAWYPGCGDDSCRAQSAEEEIRVAADDPDRIDFFSRPGNGELSGVDVEVGLGNGTLYLDLLLDDERSPERIIFVSPDTTPPNQVVVPVGIPFGLVVK